MSHLHFHKTGNDVFRQNCQCHFYVRRIEKRTAFDVEARAQHRASCTIALLPKLDMARRVAINTVRGMNRGLIPALALRQAIASVRTGADGEPPLDKPSHWAAFELFEAN